VILITAIAAIAAPVVGYGIGAVSRKVSTQKSSGFSGIHRAHFLWLWIPAYFYVASMLELAGKLITYYFTHSLFEWSSSDLGQLLYVLPFVAFAIPMCVGVGLLAGDIDRANPMRPSLRQALAVVVLILGYLIAAGVLIFLHQGASRAGLR
jgi:hypothetical protein